MLRRRIEEEALPYVVTAVSFLSEFPEIMKLKIFGSSIKGGKEWSRTLSDIDIFVLIEGEEYSCFGGHYVDSYYGLKYEELPARKELRKVLGGKSPRASLHIIERRDFPRLYFNGLREQLTSFVNVDFPPPLAIMKMQMGLKVYDRGRGISERVLFDRGYDFVYFNTGKPSPYGNDLDYLEHHGKWLIYAPRSEVLDMIVTMNRKGLIRETEITGTKYSTKPALDVPEGYNLGKDYVLIVYCDDRERESVRALLNQEIDVENTFWKYDRETLRETQDSGGNIPQRFIGLLR